MTIRVGDAVFAAVQGREVTGWVRQITAAGNAEIQLDEPQVFDDMPLWHQNVPHGIPLKVLYWPRTLCRVDWSRPNRARPAPKKAQPGATADRFNR